MKIAVHDTLTATRRLLAAPLADRPDLLRQMLEPLDGMYAFGPPGDRVDLHHRGNGFRVDREETGRYTEALDRLDDADTWDRMERCLVEAHARQREATPDIRLADEVHVVLLLGDPSDEFFVEVTGGYFGVGGFPGYVMLIAWPTDANLHKIPYAAVHELHHNMRSANVVWNPATVTVGDHVIAEGLAEAFVRQLYGPAAMGPWADPASGDEAAFRKVVDNLGLVGMQNLTPYVHGDETARRMGAEPVGLPAGAGYAVGVRLVDAHLAATGMTAAQSTCLPAAEIIRNALR